MTCTAHIWTLPPRCSALDLVPEDPSSAPLRSSALGGEAYLDTVRYRLGCLAAPLLRLLLTVLAALPDSRHVRKDAAAFAAAHHRLLCRAMADAAGTGGWLACAQCGVAGRVRGTG